MPRPFTDISYAVSGNPVKNGSVVLTALTTGKFDAQEIGEENSSSTTYSSGVYGYNSNIYSIPTIDTLSNKYGNRFYNGLFVKSIASGVIAGSGL